MIGIPDIHKKVLAAPLPERPFFHNIFLLISAALFAPLRLSLGVFPIVTMYLGSPRSVILKCFPASVISNPML